MRFRQGNASASHLPARSTAIRSWSFLDEPNSNLDAEGEQALTAAITAARARGQIVVVVAHRPSALAAVDHLLVMGEGRVQAFGPKGEVLGKVVKRPPGALGAAEAREAPQLAAGGAALKVVGA